MSLAGIKFAHPGTRRDLGVTLEIFTCMPDAALMPMPFDGKRMIAGELTSVVDLGDAK